VAFKCHLQTAK